MCERVANRIRGPTEVERTQSMKVHTKSPKFARKQENYNFCLDLNSASSDIDNYKKLGNFSFFVLFRDLPGERDDSNFLVRIGMDTGYYCGVKINGCIVNLFQIFAAFALFENLCSSEGWIRNVRQGSTSIEMSLKKVRMLSHTKVINPEK